MDQLMVSLQAQSFYLNKFTFIDQILKGFLLPNDQIIPSGQETFEGIKELAVFIKSSLTNSSLLLNANVLLILVTQFVLLL